MCLQLRALLITGLFASGLAAQEQPAFDQAVERLNQMSMAMSQMTYQGTFVYVQGSLVETMRITHVVDEDGIHERLVAQSGPQRELWRDPDGVRWIAKDSGAVMRDPSFKRSYFPDVTPAAIEQAESYYNISVGGLEPLAGHLQAENRATNTVMDTPCGSRNLRVCCSSGNCTKTAPVRLPA